jgi:hypothetical protein
MGFMSFRVRDPNHAGILGSFMPGEEGKTHSAGNHSKTDPDPDPRIGGGLLQSSKEKRGTPVRFWMHWFNKHSSLQSSRDGLK